jgi:iron complex outermembrane receptor protein
VATGKFADGSGNYWIVNGRLTYSLDHYSISAWGKNLTNKVYYPFGIAIENLFGNGYRVRAAPLTFGVEVNVSF